MGEREACAAGVACAQRAIGSIAQHQEGSFFMDAVVEDAHDIRVIEASNRFGFVEEVLEGIVGKLDAQNLNRILVLEIDMLAQIDIGKATLTQEFNQAIATYLLAQCKPIRTSRHAHM